MGTFGVVGGEIFIKRLLHLVDGFEPCPAPFDPEAFVEERSVQAFDDAVRLRTPDPRRAVLHVLQLQEQFIGVLVWPTAELPAIVGQHHLDLGLVRLECRQHVIVHHMHGGDGQLAGIEPRPGVAGMAVDGRLQIDLPDALERADEEGVHGDEGASVGGLDVAFPELG